MPTKDVYVNTLDQHADTLEGDIKPPLVLVGNEGSGKSALLANWVAKRREHKHRDEFLFQHFVGCTTQSLEVSTFDFALPPQPFHSSFSHHYIAFTYIVSFGDGIEGFLSIA